MNKKIVLLFAVFCFSINSAHAENVKYEDCDQQCVSFVEKMKQKRKDRGLKSKPSPVPYPLKDESYRKPSIDDPETIKRRKITYVMLAQGE